MEQGPRVKLEAQPRLDKKARDRVHLFFGSGKKIKNCQVELKKKVLDQFLGLKKPFSNIDLDAINVEFHIQARI